RGGNEGTRTACRFSRGSGSRPSRVCLGIDKFPRIRGESLRRVQMPHPASRRDFMNVASLGFLGLALRDYLAAAEASGEAPKGRGNSVILFWLGGGPRPIEPL